MERDGMKPILPDPGLDYLVAMFLEAGPTIVSGFGAAPLSHAEIQAYQLNKGVRLTPWEAITLRKLSLTYIEESESAKDPHAKPPYSRLVRLSRQEVDDKLTALGI